MVRISSLKIKTLHTLSYCAVCSLVPNSPIFVKSNLQDGGCCSTALAGTYEHLVPVQFPFLLKISQQTYWEGADLRAPDIH